MGAMYLTWLADVLRAKGLTVIEYAGWQTRARGSGGYDALPLCVMEHHTASNPSSDGQGDANYIATGDEDAPVANLYIQRNGTVWVIAAGATNTNGKGKSMHFSRGTVPTDGMNSRAVGIECANNGVGESWPQVQIDALISTANAVNAHIGNVATDISSHHAYAPDRKIDPATANAVQGPWKPSSVNSSGSWNLTDMGTVHTQRWGGSAPPITEDDPMRILQINDVATSPSFILTGHVATWLPTMEVYNAYINAYKIVPEMADSTWLYNCVITGPTPPGMEYVPFLGHVL